jgi:acyl-CoA thioesterase
VSAARLRDVLSPRPDGDGVVLGFAIDVPDGWQQGKGAFGGLVIGSMAAAMAATLPAARPLRSLTATLGGALGVGPARIAVSPWREGGSVSVASAQLSSGGEAVAQATALFGDARPTERDGVELPAPPELAAGWRDVTAVPMDAPFKPRFTRHFEYRTTGPGPFAGSVAPAAGWLRPLLAPDDDAPHTDATLVAMADAWWPAVLCAETRPRGAVTVAFTLQLCAAPAALPASEPLYHRGRSLAVHDGFVVEQRELWTAAGQLVALNQQTLALMR